MKPELLFPLTGIGATLVSLLILRVFGVTDQGMHFAVVCIAWYGSGMAAIRRARKG